MISLNASYQFYEEVNVAQELSMPQRSSPFWQRLSSFEDEGGFESIETPTTANTQQEMMPLLRQANQFNASVATYGATRRRRKPLQNFTEHKVDPEDSLAKIAIKYDTSIEEIKLVNGLYSDSDLLIRSLIKVPSEKSMSNITQESNEKSAVMSVTSNPEKPTENTKIRQSNPQDYFLAFDANLKQVKKEARKTIKEMKKT